MRLSPILSAYIARQFLFWLTIVFLIVVSITLLFDIVELTRRASSRESMTFGRIVSLSLLKLPTLAEKIVPFAVLFGAAGVKLLTMRLE